MRTSRHSVAQRGGDGEENFAENGLQAQTRNSHSGETGPGGASGGGRLRMRGDFAPHLDVTPSAGTCRGGASRMRMSTFGFSTHFRCTVWKYGHCRSYCEAVFGGFGPFGLHSMKKCAGGSYCAERNRRDGAGKDRDATEVISSQAGSSANGLPFACLG